MVSALVLASIAIQSDWVWWRPPTSVTAADCLGYSESRILEMGLRKWSDVADARRLGGVDRDEIVFGRCLMDRDDRLMNRQTSRWGPLRECLFRFGMACIALEDTLAGGGTYAIHEPKMMLIREETALFNALRASSRKSVLPLKSVIERYKRWKPSQERVLGGYANPEEVHRWAARIQKEFQNINRLLKGNTPSPIAEFMGSYLVAYQRVRLTSRHK